MPGCTLNRDALVHLLASCIRPALTRTLLSPSGVDLLMDVHGDEELPHVFVAGNEGIPRCALLACQQPAPGCSVQRQLPTLQYLAAAAVLLKMRY